MQKYYLENQLKSASSNLNKTWRILRELLKQHTSAPANLKVNSIIVSHKKDFADNFKEFFTNIGHKLSPNIPHLSFAFLPKK